MSDPVRWFEEFGHCQCGKSAQGILRGPRNESYGKFCRSCANKRLKKADRERERKEKHPPSSSGLTDAKEE